MTEDSLAQGALFKWSKDNSESDLRTIVINNSLAETLNIYFGVCPRNGKKGTEETVKMVRALWTDIDGKDFVGGKEAVADV